MHFIVPYITHMSHNGNGTSVTWMRVHCLYHWAKNTQSVTKTLAQRLDAFDSWSLRQILRIPYTRHVTNATVRQTTGCCPVSHLIQERWLHFFGHVARADFQQDHHRYIEASFRPSSHWRCCGRPRSTWMRGSTLMCSQLTLGSTRPREKPVTLHSGDASSTRQHSIKGHATEERDTQEVTS